MCAYPLLKGEYSCQNAGLLTGLLDDRWGFSGFVRSDRAANPSTVDSANAGLDQERGSYYWDNGLLAAAVAAGAGQALDDQRGGPPDPDRDVRVRPVQQPAHREPVEPGNTPADDTFALHVAERGTVLLQNTGQILPLSTATTKSIAVIGADGTTIP